MRSASQFAPTGATRSSRLKTLVALAALVTAVVGLQAADPTLARTKPQAAPSSEKSPAQGAAAHSGSVTSSKDAMPSIADKVTGLERHDGLLTLYLDRARGKVWLAVPPPGPRGEVGRYLYVEGLVSGLGSNPVGLDRGQLGASRILVFRRMGGRLLIEQENLRYRALSVRPEEARAVRESFASSVLWGGEIAAADVDGGSLVDLTSFVTRDAHDVVGALKASGQGEFSLDESRSAVDLEGVLAFPDNLEFEALLTFAGRDPGPLVREVAEAPKSLTLIQHQALVRLPDDDYTPRAYDPRSGFFAIGFANYAAPLGAPIATRWIVRHRLQKTDPAAARSPVRKPIVYYVDPAAPEPVRQALIDGARWWARAFEKAGFIDAFRVETLPPGVHPLDVRYNVIEWIHRSTRGWSYGSGVVDPRTGEMIKAHVSLDSLRVRQDRLILEGLAGVEKTGTGSPDDPIVISLQRIRQLSAHEVGHTLGLAHNFAASTQGRTSVMDYPAPLVTVGADGALDFSKAYAPDIGAWDYQAIQVGYGQAAPGVDEKVYLAQMLSEFEQRGLLFLTDDDARPAGAADARASLWDNGDEPVTALKQTLAVRKAALGVFGARNLGAGMPLALLQDVLAPLYFHHRYQLQATVKLVGGVSYQHRVRGGEEKPAVPILGGNQRVALDAVLDALAPEQLDLPEPVLALLLPRPPEFEDRRESFPAGATSPTFDALGAAASAANIAVRGLLAPERAARMVDQHRRDETLPGLEELLDRLVRKAFPAAPRESARLAEIRRSVQQVVVRGLIELAADENASPAVRSRTEGQLRKLSLQLNRRPEGVDRERDHREFMALEIDRWLGRQREAPTSPPPAPPPPPGDPIGCSLEAQP